MALYSPPITNFWKFYNPKADHYNIYSYSTMNDSMSFKDMIVLKAYCDILWPNKLLFENIYIMHHKSKRNNDKLN